jgi:hypothetical protein
MWLTDNMIKSLEFAHFTNNMHIYMQYGLIYTYYMWSQSEFNFLRLQINITEYTFVYVLRWMLTSKTLLFYALGKL